MWAVKSNRDNKITEAQIKFELVFSLKIMKRNNACIVTTRYIDIRLLTLFHFIFNLYGRFLFERVLHGKVKYDVLKNYPFKCFYHMDMGVFEL